jgi:hypothetical protein
MMQEELIAQDKYLQTLDPTTALADSPRADSAKLRGGRYV